MTEWRRWLGSKGDNRNVARAITGACNLGFLFLVMSGFYLCGAIGRTVPDSVGD